MHIVKVAFECAAFDVRLMLGGTASLAWNLARQFVDAGHRVSMVTPAHGHIDHLNRNYDVEELGPADRHTVPLVLDRQFWPDHPPEIPLSLVTRTFRLRHEGVDIYFLSDSYLDLLPDRLYPPNEFQGRNLAFFKPLVFQVGAIRCIERNFGGEPLVIQAYEPYYHYLLPAVLGGCPDRTMVSTVAVNAPISGKVYRPQLERILELFGTTVDLDRLADSGRQDTPLTRAMANYLRPSYRRADYGGDYTNYFALVATHTDVIDFLTPGQRDYYSTFADAPSERMFQQLTVSRIVKETVDKQFVGGCALPNWWLELDTSTVDRGRVLGALGLDPARPTFYHAARLDHNHKGQTELMRAIDRVLRVDRDVNFVIRCAVGVGGQEQPVPGDPAFQEIADRYPDNLHLDWRMVDEEVLYEQAASSEFCVFPSKFELDAFLITMGEAMACGAVPIATAQTALRHYEHHRLLADPLATGFAVPRSFRTNDRQLEDRLVSTMLAALDLFRHDRATYRRLSANARAVAHTFTWTRCAKARLDRFAAAARRQVEPHPDELAIEYGWFDRLGAAAWVTHRERIARAALSFGDLDAYRRCAPVDAAAVARLFEAAYQRADFERCGRLAELAGERQRRLIRERCRIVRAVNGRRVEYHLPHADRVELVTPSAGPRGAGSGNRYLRQLTRRGDCFAGELPEELAGGPLVFLLTLRSGRVAWDQVVTGA